jgi:predicted phosphodiesterase
MKIIQLSDLHIDSSFKLESHQVMLDKAIEVIQKEIGQEKYIYIVVCGDIVTGGKASCYKEAKEIMNFFKIKLKPCNLRFLFVPGNHDLCENSFKDFDDFIKPYNNELSFDNGSVNIWEDDAIRFILLNTSYHKDTTFGNFDEKELKKLEFQKKPSIIKPTVTIMHHTLMSRYNSDKSELNDAYNFINYLDSTSSVALLHGHTHGVSDIVVGKNCRLIGVGSLFKKILNCNNQFNIIDINNDNIQKIDNYKFQSDSVGFLKQPLFTNDEKYFSGLKMSEIYEKVRSTVLYRTEINNLHAHINTKYQDYVKDMEKYFKKDIKTAEGWLALKCPDTLYYNHGKYMVVNDEKDSGIDHVIKTLKRNATSTHAIIPLINLRDVVNSHNDRYPGLCSIQFKFKNNKYEELCCSVYIRSLEVSKFMKINLAEIYLLIKKIKFKISFERVDISIFAFKVDYREKFNAFVKAKMDMMTEAKIANIIYKNKNEDMINLLENKFELNITEVDTSGIESIISHMKESGKYGRHIINLFNEIVKYMEELENEQSRNSNYSEMNEIQNKISDKAKTLIEELQKKGKHGN